jgi:hypothetical protein
MSLLSTLRQTVEKNNCDETQLDPEIAYEMLKNRRRRCILQYVAAQDDTPVTVSDLADYLARHHDEDRTAVYVAAIQSHLPKMSQARVCSYDENRKLVELTPRGRAVIEVHQTAMELLG